MFACPSDSDISLAETPFLVRSVAKRIGMKNFLVKPINKKEEFQIVLKRILEKIVLKEYRYKMRAKKGRKRWKRKFGRKYFTPPR